MSLGLGLFNADSKREHTEVFASSGNKNRVGNNGRREIMVHLFTTKDN